VTTPQVIITVMTTLAVIGGIIWTFTFGRRIRWPAGEQHVGYYGTVKIVLVLERGRAALPPLVHPKYLAAHCGKATECAHTAWIESAVEDRFKTRAQVPEVTCCWIRPDAAFDDSPTLREFSRHAASVLGQVPRAIGSGPPCCVLRESVAHLIVESGQPIVHEMIHHWARDTGLHPAGADHLHGDASLWESGGPDSIEARAVARFREGKP
jgi:hypothetical protein